MATQALDMNAITRAFIKIRNARADLKHRYDTEDGELKAKQAQLEAVMLDHLIRTRSEAMRTDAGTFYRQEDIKPSCADWSSFYSWIKDNDAFDALEQRIKKTFVKTFMETHDGAMPPGVSVHREFVVRVRKA